ncbi:MAG: S8 family serine peptidase, partial [Chitinophagales bacterium]
MATLTPTTDVYTYRNGEKIYLNKETDKFVVRAKPDEIEKMKKIENLEEIEPVSPASTRVTLRVGDLDTVMDEMRETNVTHHAYSRADNNAEFLVTDRILVTFRQPATDDQINAFMAKYALHINEKYSNKDFLFQLTDATGMNPVKLVVLINETEMDLVESCEHDLNKRMNKATINLPTDPKYLQQWHLHRKLNNAAFDARSSSKCEDAWQLLNHFGSSDVVIGVTDDGCKISHTDFDSVGKFAHWGYMSGSSLISRDSISADPNLMYETGSDHGTCCSGVIGAEVDGVLTVGAAPGCRLLPIKWQSTGPSLSISDSKMITVLNFIADKVDVLSNSWGSAPESSWASGVISKITQLAQNGGRRNKGIVFLWAAGNENCPIKFSGNLNVPYDDGYNESGNWQGVSTSKIFDDNLVGIPGVIHIAALASNAQRSHYSNYGTGISVCAPSSNSHEYWRMTVSGLGILTSSGLSPFFSAKFGGTSSATPLVAGICGLVISANPQLTAFEVVSVIQRTAGKDLNMTPYPKTPSAPYDPNTAWDISPVPPFDNGNFSNVNHTDGTWSSWFGFGVVNAEAAVAEALRMAGPAIAATSITKTSSPGIAIPDNNPIGIRNVIAVADQGTISSVMISLDITHSY